MALLPFRITRQFEREKEDTVSTFKHEKDALESMESKVTWDHKTRVNTIYRLYKLENNVEKMIKEVNAMHHETLASAESSGSGKGAGFTPLSTSPKPPGSGPSRKHEDDIDEQ